MVKKNFRVEAEVVNGKCPTCDQFTLLVSIDQHFFRCMSCGSDLEQHINGKITYLPVITSPRGTKPFVKEWLDDDGEKFKDFIAHEPTFHKTNIGRNPSKAKMNKSRRRSWKNIAAKENNEIFIDGVHLLCCEWRLFHQQHISKSIRQSLRLY